MKACQGLFTYLSVEATQRRERGFRIVEQRACRVQPAIIAAQSRERFDTGDAARGGINKRLEYRKRLTVEHCAVP